MKDDNWTPPDMQGILGGPVRDERELRELPRSEAHIGMYVQHISSGFSGKISQILDERQIVVRSPTGRERLFVLRKSAFKVGERTVVLRVEKYPRPAQHTAKQLFTRSGSLALPHLPARQARASRLYVEGIHDAELIEKVWGDDLQVEGIAVEILHGADALREVVQAFQPGPDQRLGVLLDHLIPHTKETRLAAEISHPNVLITGHPYVDIWMAVKPTLLGLRAWPQIPKGIPWKEGVCTAIGAQNPAVLWHKILGSIRTYDDLETPLIQAVETLIDFVTTE